MSAPLIVVAVLVLLAFVIIARTVNIIQQGYVGIVKRLGEFHSVRQPGVTFLVPLVDSMVTVDSRETPRTGDKQDVITRDNVTVSVNATIFSQVVDPKLALFSVSNYFVAIDQLSRTTLRAIFGGMSLDDALSQRERINAQLQAQMESVTDKWGIRINRIEIVDITPPQMILNALALQKTADQEKRAFILKSEGQQQSQINIADGQKQGQIKTAEGDKQSAILRAEGLRQATILEAEGRAQAIATVYKAIKDAAPDPTLVSILQLDTLSKFAASENAKLVVPVETAGLLGAAQALRSVLDGVPTAAAARADDGGAASLRPSSADREGDRARRGERARRSILRRERHPGSPRRRQGRRSLLVRVLQSRHRPGGGGRRGLRRSRLPLTGNRPEAAPAGGGTVSSAERHLRRRLDPREQSAGRARLRGGRIPADRAVGPYVASAARSLKHASVELG